MKRKTDIYSRKGRFKIGLVLGAVILIAVSQYYAGRLVKRMANEEQKKAELWAAALTKRAELIRLTSDLFERIAEDQRQRMETWAGATKLVVYSEQQDLSPETTSYLSQIISRNNNIPVVQLDKDKEIINARNTSFDNGPYPSPAQPLLDSLFSDYTPIEIIYPGGINYLYYADSKIYNDLKVTLHDLVNSFLNEVVVNSASLPVLLVNDQQKLLAHSGVDSTLLAGTQLAQTLEDFSAENKPIKIELTQGETRYIYYQNSTMLKQLKWFPLAQFLLTGAFLLVGYVLFSISRNAEQNRVWVGLAKETAHQLGTPISSLGAWVEYIRATPSDALDTEMVAKELTKDIERLELVTDRFSKIGAKPEMQEEDAAQVLRDVTQYFQKRKARNLSIELQIEDEPLPAKLNASLFGWVIENLIKNAIDAMEGQGKLTIRAYEGLSELTVEISDTGKGIPKSQFKTIFQPGFSTKKRGWGLGLSLSKRIIQDYHKGRIYVASSSKKGSTFHIVIPLAK